MEMDTDFYIKSIFKIKLSNKSLKTNVHLLIATASSFSMRHRAQSATCYCRRIINHLTLDKLRPESAVAHYNALTNIRDRIFSETNFVACTMSSMIKTGDTCMTCLLFWPQITVFEHLSTISNFLRDHHSKVQPRRCPAYLLDREVFSTTANGACSSFWVEGDGKEERGAFGHGF